jgi:ribonuclease R
LARKISSERTPSVQGETPLPSREDILAFIARERDAAQKSGAAHPAKIGKREIARA